MKLSLTIATMAAFMGTSAAFSVDHPSMTRAAFLSRRTASSMDTASPSTTTCLWMAAAMESIEEVEMDTEERMGKSVDSVKLNLQSVRTGRANAAILDRVQVNYYGAQTPLNQMASISVPSAQQLQVDPYDKSTLTDVERAIVDADLGITPSNDGATIRINIPQLTEERRKDLMKQCKSIGEDGKVAVRNVRRDGVESLKKMEKAKTLGEDQMLDGTDMVQKMTDKSIKDIDDIVKVKEKEVMTV